jgi:hypothetical protein
MSDEFLPESGQIFAFESASSQHCGVMDADLIARVCASTGLSSVEAVRVIEDVVAFFAEPVESYVRRRHAELQARGRKNPEIFTAIRAELAHRVVAPPPLSDRQLRRLVYG